MNRKQTKITTEFGPIARFELDRLRAVPFRAALPTELERLENRLLQDLLNRTADPELGLLYRHALREAAALAAATGYPLLTLPSLFQEKAEAARHYAVRQARIRTQTGNLAEASA